MLTRGLTDELTRERWEDSYRHEVPVLPSSPRVKNILTIKSEVSKECRHIVEQEA